MTLGDLQQALAGARYETARRIGLSLLKQPGQQQADILLLLHDACINLAEFTEARKLLEGNTAALKDRVFDTALCLAGDYRHLINDGHYRTSEEAKQGFSIDEYQAKYRKLAEDSLQKARSLAETDTHQGALERFQKGNPKAPFTTTSATNFKVIEAPVPDSAGSGTVQGQIFMEDGSSAGNVTVSIGLKVAVEIADPAQFTTHSMGYHPVIGPLSKLTIQTASDGRFVFSSVPSGAHEFLAVTLDPLVWDIPTRFLLHSLQVGEGETLDLGVLKITTWKSADPAPFTSPHPESIEEDGARWHKCGEWKLRNPFYYEFPRQLLTLTAPENASSLKIRITPGQDEPFQAADGQVHLLTGLASRSDKVIALYESNQPSAPAVPTVPVQLIRDSDSLWILDTGVAAFRIAGDKAALSASPLQGICGVDGRWRGQGRFALPQGIHVTQRKTHILAEGPLLVSIELSHIFSNGKSYSLRLTALAGEPLLLVHEISDACDDAAFEFSLNEFSGGRGFLHWGPEAGSYHWTSLKAENKNIALLPESIPWWIPPQGFGYAMTRDGLEEKDYIGVFTRHRGDWIDRAFERIAQGPIDADGTENRELDWPFPEMVGSSISMIRAFTTESGDAFFRFGFFDGERQWGILASSFEKNDGPAKEFARLQHAYSSPRLQEFKEWNLDVPDSVQRPHVVAQRCDLIQLRQKAASSRFSHLWDKIKNRHVPGARLGLVFAVDNDPLVAWHKRIQLLTEADIRSKMTLLGRDWSDMYSPVGGRNITPWAEEYDLIAASGVFTGEEERSLRAFFILMGHLYMEPDFMNWKFNGRNANFEADRADIIGAVGLVFHGHPDAAKFIDHVIDRTKSSLIAYCTPGSGKWYENPACYYLHASKCRMNLIYHLAHKGMLDLDSIPRLRDFLRWGIVLLTPPQPVSYKVMCDGGEEAFLQTEKIRKVPPIGDHASVGRWLPEHYFLTGKLYQGIDPVFGRELIDAYFSSSGDGQRLLENQTGLVEQVGEQLFHDVAAGSSFGNLPLFFSAIKEADIPASPEIQLASRRLEGFGAVLRNRFNTPEEDYLLIKQGPGGYRYHRTEGSFVLFAKGRPLIYDGGEAGETWRHSTLSFYDVHMPLSAGHVERYFSGSSFQFVQGVHPEIIAPGKPVFLSDSCEHQLVEESYLRFRKEKPAAVRSFAWVENDYLVVHDSLDLPEPLLSHWHLQVVGGAPSGNVRDGFLFPGRFGVDLQVLLPNQSFDSEKGENLAIMEYHGSPQEWFTMQHLQLGKNTARDYLAILRPLEKGSRKLLSATTLEQEGRIIGTRVTGANRRDILFFSHTGIQHQEDLLTFSGTYGALLEGSEKTCLQLIGAGELRINGYTLRSKGPTVSLTLSQGTVTLHAEGQGFVSLEASGKFHEFDLTGDSPLHEKIS